MASLLREMRLSHPLLKGLRATLPVALAVAPFGLAYGAVAAQTMPPWQAQLMSVMVFAGTAQFVAASMLASGAAHWTILVTGLLINLRMLLMSAALAARLGKTPRWLQCVMAHLLTDESFAVTMAEFDAHPPHPLFPAGSGLAIFIIWQVSTAVGVAAGASIPAGLGLEFALPASLVCLLFLLVRDRGSLWVACLAAALALALRPILGSTWTTMTATMAAASLGVMYRQWRSRA